MFAQVRDALLHLAFPHLCAGCGNSLSSAADLLCIRCIADLPLTGFHRHADNPVEKVFWGRLPLAGATAHCYFTRDSLMQTLMHEFKYRGHRELGFFLGRQMGQHIATSGRFRGVDALVPLPLFASRERRRGYNQAFVLCQGMAEAMKIPVLKDAVRRSTSTETQTKKSRVERWRNMEGRFELCGEGLEGKHLLLVDDVITTGATLEACGRELLTVKDLQLSVAALCYSRS
jgi:ComF family protein